MREREGYKKEIVKKHNKKGERIETRERARNDTDKKLK